MTSPLRGGGKLADKIFNKYNITKEEREEVKNEIANGGGGGDTEEVWYILKQSDYDLSSNTLSALISMSITFNLIQAYIEVKGGGAYLLNRRSIEATLDMSGYNIRCFSFSGGILCTNQAGEIYTNIKSDKIETMLELYLNVFGTDLPPEELEQTKLMMNDIIQEVNNNYDCVNKEQMIAYLESICNN